MAEVPNLIGCYWTLAGPIEFGDHDDSPWDLELRCRAASEAGYTAIGLKHADLVKSIGRHGYSGIERMLKDNGLHVAEVEALTDWWCDGARRGASDCVRANLLEAASRFGTHHIKAYGELPAATACDRGRLKDAFTQLAHEAALAGTMAVLEPIGCSSVPDLGTGLAIVRDSLGKGGGLMLDLFHMTRGDIDFDEIAALPPEAIGCVEISDGPAQPELAYLDECLNSRLLPGRGAFDLPGFVNAVRKAGYDGPWGVEIISAHERSLPLDEAAGRSHAAATNALRACWGHV